MEGTGDGAPRDALRECLSRGLPRRRGILNGIEWHLIEIEPPVTKGIYSPKLGFKDRARRGIQQIREWRAFIRENRDQLHKPAARWGGCLPRIDDRAKGWVIVGRADDFEPEHEWMRRELLSNENIEVRSWDFVLRTLRGWVPYNETVPRGPFPDVPPLTIEEPRQRRSSK